ncbi:MAG: hypothetical protein GYA43_12230 [Bacteroidales bacterium]|nr:hypothetical protein [Bacteroidales bacterium]
MQKLKRLVAIENIIAGGNVSSQAEIIRRLKRSGIRCTQATMSRSLRQLGVIKVPDGKGGYRYAVPSSESQKPAPVKGFELVSIIRSIIEVKSMLLIKTSPGYANSVAVTIDNAGRYEIAGTIAGDDTLLVIPRDKITTAHLHKILGLIFPGIEKIPIS